MKKKHCYKKRGSDIYRKSYYATFYLKLRQDFCISRSENGLYKVFAVKKKKKKKKSLKVVNNKTTTGALTNVDLSKLKQIPSTDIHDRLD